MHCYAFSANTLLRGRIQNLFRPGVLSFWADKKKDKRKNKRSSPLMELADKQKKKRVITFYLRGGGPGQMFFFFRGLLFTSHWLNLQHWTGFYIAVYGNFQGLFFAFRGRNRPEPPCNFFPGGGGGHNHLHMHTNNEYNRVKTYLLPGWGHVPRLPPTGSANVAQV